MYDFATHSSNSNVTSSHRGTARAVFFMSQSKNENRETGQKISTMYVDEVGAKNPYLLAHLLEILWLVNDNVSATWFLENASREPSAHHELPLTLTSRNHNNVDHPPSYPSAMHMLTPP